MYDAPKAGLLEEVNGFAKGSALTTAEYAAEVGQKDFAKNYFQYVDLLEKKYLVHVIKDTLPIYFAEHFQLDERQRRKPIDWATRRYHSDLGAYDYRKILTLTCAAPTEAAESGLTRNRGRVRPARARRGFREQPERPQAWEANQPFGFRGRRTRS